MKTKAKFTFEKVEEIHLIKFKKRNYWWLLLFLLLLLPLLLLIRFEKDIIFKTVSSSDNSPLSGTFVNFRYQRQEIFNFSSKKFFFQDSIKLSGNSDSAGVVVFKDVSYTLYSIIFYKNVKSFVTATNNCYSADSLRPIFHELKDNMQTIISLSQRTINLDFLVVDESDGEPLPDADVELSDKNGKSFHSKTNANGEVIFENMAFCSTVKAVGSKYGYANDSVQNDVEILLSDIENRKLKLNPIKSPIKFLVKDLDSKEVLPGVQAKLMIENIAQTVTTNTNGIGKGIFEDVHVIKKMHIETSKIFYYDTISPVYTVSDYIKLSDSERTIYMRPQTQSIEFYNTKGTTSERLAGVSNKISINGKVISTEISNTNGIFTIAKVFPNDKISIVSSKPGFGTNSSKVNNKTAAELSSQESRTIPLTANPPPPPPPEKDDEFKGEDGDLRINLQWKTYDDLDIRIADPCGKEVWAFALTQTCQGGVGTLDIDANTNRYPKSTWTKTPQENAFWKNPTKGKYTIRVEHCIKQDMNSPDPVKFNVTVIYKGKRSDFKGQVSELQKVVVCNFNAD